MSLAQALATAVSGLRTTQSGMALVASNVANAQTPGYVRKTLDQTASGGADVGISVRTEGINRVLDQYLQTQLRTESAGGAYADLKSQFYQRLQTVYGDPGAAGGIESVYNNFTNAVQALSTSPEDYSARTAVLSSAQTLTQQLNSLTGGIQGLRSDAESALSSAVGSANEAMQQIAALNRELATASSSDAAAATLLDRRDQYIDQLAQLMDIRVTTGDFNQVSVFTSSGVQLVGTRAAQLAFSPQGAITPTAQWSADPQKRGVGTITLTSPTGASIDLIANQSIRSGQIAAKASSYDKLSSVQASASLSDIASISFSTR